MLWSFILHSPTRAETKKRLKTFRVLETLWRAFMCVIQNFKERVQSPVFNTAVEFFAANPIRLSTLQPEGKFRKTEVCKTTIHMSVSILLPAASAHRDGHGGAISTFVVELLDTVINFLTVSLTIRPLGSFVAWTLTIAPVSCLRTSLLCPKATS